MKTKADTLIELKERFDELNILPIYTLYSDEFFANMDYQASRIVEFSCGSEQ